MTTNAGKRRGREGIMTDKAKTHAKRKYHCACAPGDLSEVQPVNADTGRAGSTSVPPPPSAVAANRVAARTLKETKQK